MMFLEMLGERNPRRMVCTNPKCPQHGIVVQEPVFSATPELERVPTPAGCDNMSTGELRSERPAVVCEACGGSGWVRRRDRS